MRFDEVKAAVGELGFMTPWQGRRVYDHITSEGVRDVLEIGTAYGVSAAYMAAGLAANGGGKVRTVDRFHYQDPSPEEVVARAGLSDYVEFVRMEHSSYDWWLKDEVLASRDPQGAVVPRYDFCYLDGTHDWHIDGLAVVLIEPLLRDGSWLLMDDLNWLRREDTPAPPPPSADELREPALRAVWDAVVRVHPAFSSWRLEDEDWGWAQKGQTGDRRYETITTSTTSTLLGRRLRLALKRLRARR